MASITALATPAPSVWALSTSNVLGSTIMPPLNAAIGADNVTFPAIIFMPRGGRPLVTANFTLAASKFWIAAAARSVSRFWLSTSVPSTSAKSREIFS